MDKRSSLFAFSNEQRNEALQIAFRVYCSNLKH
jgi:hypothetical protein